MMRWLDERSIKRGLERGGRKQRLPPEHDRGRQWKKGRQSRSRDLNCSNVIEILNRIPQGEVFVRRVSTGSMKLAELVHLIPPQKRIRWWTNFRECQVMCNFGEERAE